MVTVEQSQAFPDRWMTGFAIVAAIVIAFAALRIDIDAIASVTFVLVPAVVILPFFANTFRDRLIDSEIPITPADIVVVCGFVVLGSSGGALLAVLVWTIEQIAGGRAVTGRIRLVELGAAVLLNGAVDWVVAVLPVIPQAVAAVVRGGVVASVIVTIRPIAVSRHTCADRVTLVKEYAGATWQYWVGIIALGTVFGIGRSEVGLMGAMIPLFVLLALPRFHAIQRESERTWRELYLLALAVSLNIAHIAKHAEATRRLAMKLGRGRGLSRPILHDIAILAMVHDIGRAGLDRYSLDYLLDSLTAAKQQPLHAARGAEIIGRIDGLSHVAPAVLAHHSPLAEGGRVRDRLDEATRIVAVASAYDDLINGPGEELYRPEEAHRRLKRDQGLLYDPKAVRTLRECLIAEGAMRRRAVTG